MGAEITGVTFIGLQHSRSFIGIQPIRDRGTSRDVPPPTPPYIRNTYTAVRRIESKKRACARLQPKHPLLVQKSWLHPIWTESAGTTDAVPRAPHLLIASLLQDPSRDHHSGLRSHDLLCPLQTSTGRSEWIAPPSANFSGTPDPRAPSRPPAVRHETFTA